MFTPFFIRSILFLIISTMAYPCFSAEEKEKAGLTEVKPDSFKEDIKETSGIVTINGKEIPYKVNTGTITLKNDKGETKANIFYVAYTKQDEQNLLNRPITFCFNGGPGASSVWLHIGALGPKKIALDSEGMPLFPYHLENNDHSMLDLSDLVFIDPVSTGYSRAPSEEEAKQFHGVEEDIKSVGEFIRLYTTRNNRWGSPLYLAGESYGTTRAAGLSLYLHDNFNMHLNGLILVSSAINYQAFDFRKDNDLAYINFLPTYTSSAWYHKKLIPELQNADLMEVLKEAKEFAQNDYNIALMQGDDISPEAYEAVVQKMARLTTLSPEVIKQCNLRIPMWRFGKELLKDKGELIGRFDSRYKGFDFDKSGNECPYDPSLEILAGAFTSAINQYFHTELKWESDHEYRVLANVQPWNFGKATNQYLNMTDSLREVMTKNPHLQTMVACGLYDLATPFVAAQYMFGHLDLDPALRQHVKLSYYEAGHMMFLHKPSLIKLKQDISDFVEATK